MHDLKSLWWFDGDHFQFLGVFEADRVDDGIIAHKEKREYTNDADYEIRDIHINRMVG